MSVDEQQANTTTPTPSPLRFVLRGISADELRQLNILWQRQHDADWQAAIEAERSELETSLQADRTELAGLEAKLTQLRRGDVGEAEGGIDIASTSNSEEAK